MNGTLYDLMARPESTFVNGTLRGNEFPVCAGQPASIGNIWSDHQQFSSTEHLLDNSTVGYCETFSFTYSMGALSGINMGVVAIMWLYVVAHVVQNLRALQQVGHVAYWFPALYASRMQVCVPRDDSHVGASLSTLPGVFGHSVSPAPSGNCHFGKPTGISSSQRLYS